MPATENVDPRAKYKRVVLKLSGEVLRGGKNGDAIDGPTLEKVCRQVKEIHDLGVQVCVVIGGGNIFRGLAGEQRGVDRTTGDYMGMLATVINSLALMDRLEKMGAPRKHLRLNRTGIPLEAFPFQERTPPADGAWRIVQACRLIAKKGLRAALEAFAKFRAELKARG